MTVKVIKDDVPLLVKAMLAVSRDEAVVGVFADGPARRDDGPPNSLIAYVMETGDPSRNIPARPFFALGALDARDAVIATLSAALKQGFRDAISLKGLSGQQDGPVLQGLKDASMLTRNAVQSRMERGPFVPLAPPTIRARRKRGNTSTKPLLDTRQLRDAVEARVRPKARRGNA